jgi:hypothetical protein
MTPRVPTKTPIQHLGGESQRRGQLRTNLCCHARLIEKQAGESASKELLPKEDDE